jgi:hypothetical protein
MMMKKLHRYKSFKVTNWLAAIVTFATFLTFLTAPQAHAQYTGRGGSGSSAWSAITGKPTTVAGYGITDSNYFIGTFFVSNTLQVLGSNDGINWTTIKANAYTPSTGVLRDPSIIPISTVLWCAYTAGPTFGDADFFALAKSTDNGLTWAYVKNVTSITSATHTWGPDWFLDADGSIHIIVGIETDSSGSGNMHFYELHPTTADPAGAWSAATRLTEIGGAGTAFEGSHQADSTVLKAGNVYNIIYNGASRMDIATSPALLGPYTDKGPISVGGSTTINGEGMTMFPTEQGFGMLYKDPITARLNFTTSLDLITWGAPVLCTGGSVDTFENGNTIRSSATPNLALGAISPKLLDGAALSPSTVAATGTITAPTVTATGTITGGTLSGSVTPTGQLRLVQDTGWTTGGIRFNGASGAFLGEFSGQNILGLRLPSSGLAIWNSAGSTQIGGFSDAGNLTVNGLTASSFLETDASKVLVSKTAAQMLTDLGVTGLSRQTFSNAAVTVTAGTTVLAQTGTMSASRIVTFPAASAYAAGSGFTIVDESGTITATNNLSLARAGSDTINGATTGGVSTAYAAPFYRSDGTSKWTSDIQGVTRGGTGATTAAGALTNLGAAPAGGWTATTAPVLTPFVAQATGVNMAATGTTDIFTVPTGKTFVLQDCFAVATTVSVFVSGPVMKIIESGGSLDMSLASTTTNTGSWSVAGRVFGITRPAFTGGQNVVVCTAGNIVRLNITTAAVATTFTANVFVVGFYY